MTDNNNKQLLDRFGPTVALHMKHEFNEAAARFADNPSGDNWNRLERAMWAHQGWAPGGSLTQEERVSIILKVGIGYWQDEIVKIVKGES